MCEECKSYDLLECKNYDLVECNNYNLVEHNKTFNKRKITKIAFKIFAILLVLATLLSVVSHWNTVSICRNSMLEATRGEKGEVIYFLTKNYQEGKNEIVITHNKEQFSISYYLPQERPNARIYRIEARVKSNLTIHNDKMRFWWLDWEVISVEKWK